MNKFVIAVIIAVTTGILFTSCNRNIVAQKEDMSYYYDCPMHRDYIRYKPGNCQICGMTLDKWEIGKMEKRNLGNSNNSSNSHNGHTGTGSSGGHGGHH